MNQLKTPPELSCLHTQIVNFLVYRLKNDLITQKRVTQFAQAVLAQLTENLTHDQIHQALDQLKLNFPELTKDIDAAGAACETQAARQLIDQQVLSQISSGNIDQALAQLAEVKV